MVMTMWKSTFCVTVLCVLAGCSTASDDPGGVGLGVEGAAGQAGVPAAGPGPAGGSTSPGMGGTAGGATAPVGGSTGAAATGASGSSGMGAAGGTTAAGAGGAAGEDTMTAGAGAGGSTEPTPGGLPRADEMNVEQMGPYAFDSYTEGLDNPTYASSIMYYPTDAAPPFGVVAFSPGFTATKEQYMDFLGPLLASHGIAILLTTPTTTGDFPTQRSEDLQAALEQIAKENEREGSPLKGKLATDRTCVTGHSMGGGGTLWAASELGDKVRCAVPLQPWQPGQSFSMIVAPTMFIAAEADSVAGVSSNASLFYESIPETVPKYYVEFAGASHYLTSNTRGSNYEGQSKYMIAFYKVYLEDDMRYLDVLNAPMDGERSEYRKSQ